MFTRQQYISENSKQRKSTSVRKLDLDGNHHVCRNVEETAATDPEKPTDSNDDKPTFQPLCGEISASKSESLPDEFKVIPDSADAALHLENNSQNEDNSLVLSSEVPLNSVAQEFTSTKDSELPKESTELQKIDAVLKENGHHETVSPTSPFDIQTDTIPKFDGTPDMEISLERNEFSQAKDSTILIESHDLKNANATSLANGHHQSVIPNSRFIVPKDIIPKLDGAPNTEICLEDESPQKRGVQSLIHRFMIHTSTMRTHCEPHEVEMR